jgi:NAD(P)H-dependent FMN reductase
MSEPLQVLVVLGSTRPSREGEKVARAIHAAAAARADLRAELVDLRDWPLPFFDEPKPLAAAPPGLELARRWGEKVAGADAFVLVTPEYNHGYPAVLKNALDYAWREWARKPVAFASYSGGAAAGLRAVEQLRQVVVELQMAPLREQVSVARVWQAFEADGRPKDPAFEKAAGRMYEELAWWGLALRAARRAG